MNTRVVHTCHWPGCPAKVPPAMWGCRKHWFTLPKMLRDRIWANYRPGQEIDKRPSETYLEVASAVQLWIRGHLEMQKSASNQGSPQK
jgi:hypothetical protein